MSNIDFDYRELYKNFYKIEFNKNYIVHHIDGNHQNNNVENLVLLPVKLHSKYHYLKNLVEDFVKNNKIFTQITGNRVSEPVFSNSILCEFLEILSECNKWFDFREFLLGKIPNIHNIQLEEN